jgi:TPR repeat protein
MYRRGKGLPQNKTKAIVFYKKSCKMGSSSSCSKVRRLTEEGY